MEFEVKPLDIVCFHVGGCGSYGPIDAILYSPFKEDVLVVVFEARDASDDLLVQQEYMNQGVRTMLVPWCIADEIGKITFYVNNAVASSSIFKAAEQAKDQHVLYTEPPAITWNDVTQIDSIMELDAITLDEVVRRGLAPAPDVLSIDAQGAEYRIMKGGIAAMQGITCVVTEIEFFEIYAGQNLFCDQFCFLQNQGFRLADILNQQFWHPAPGAGKGFLSVGEALFLREVETLLASDTLLEQETTLYKLIKLAAISYSFQRYSHVYQIVELLLKHFGNRAEAILEKTGKYSLLLQLYRFMHKNLDRYYQDCFFFTRHNDNFESFAKYGEFYEEVLGMKHELVNSQQACTELQQLHTHYQQQTQNELQHLKTAIAAMETSKFWKLRTLWVRFKQHLRSWLKLNR